ncbi:MAG: biopolymer transporter ExbD [Gammaproteobacteria bacterium]|nr:biopolymer transporter ExbD [Gammaproteobacteria bacterium]
MKHRSRHRTKEADELDITAFLNLMVILVPFLLITAVFSQVTILEMNLPPSSDQQTLDNKPEKFQLEIIIRKSSLNVYDRPGSLLKRLPNSENGERDYKALSKLLQQLKARFPDKQEAMILSERDTSYDALIQVMDTVRMFETLQTGSLVQAELFPELALGDAPPEDSKGQKQ